MTDADDAVDELVNRVETAGGDGRSDGVVVKTRKLWNWNDRGEDADVELRIGWQVNLGEILQTIRGMERWTVRFLDTSDTEQYPVTMALIYHQPEPDPDGTLFHDQL